MSYYKYSNSSYYRPTPFGGFRFFPPVIKVLIVSNVAIYLLSSFFGLFRFDDVSFGAVLNYIFALYPIDAGFQLWQLFTYMFMHGGLMHLLFNMFALWMFGMELENTWGSKKFLIYYLVCGLGAALANLFIAPIFGPTGPTVGASGSIYGVLLAFGMLFPDRPIFLYFLLPIKARYFVMMYIALELYAGMTGTPDGIAHFAHLGGAAVGFIYLMIDMDRIPLRKYWEVWHRSSAKLGRYRDSSERGRKDVSDASYFDIKEHPNSIDQARIDEILDKISKSGYQNLSEEEKRILFDASKKLN